MKDSKNILVLSSIYPGTDVPSNFTPVVHYFVKEWSRVSGINIRVIHTPAYFPEVLYRIPQKIQDFVSLRLGFPFPKKRLSEFVEYNYDGIKVFRVPLFKKIPMGKFATSELTKQSKFIINLLQNDGFIPDIIVSHWFNPQVFISKHLKTAFNSKTVLTLHENVYKYRNLKHIREYVESIDTWGFRNFSIRDNFNRTFKINPTIHCMSGIPEIFLKDVPKRNYNNLNSFIFIGGLLQRKYPDKLIDAIGRCFGNESFVLNIVGDGPMRPMLEKKIANLSIKGHINLLGRKNRSEIPQLLDTADVFIMISKGEAFGLVYLEAMARGCIVVASKDEGMEGIIQNGINGFLCEAGNDQELEKIINHIKSLPPIQLNDISLNAIQTASKLTDKHVAMKYLSDILQE